MPRLTKAYHQEELTRVENWAFRKGQVNGAEAKEQELRHAMASAKLQQLQAAAKLMEEMGRMASRVGYMVGKINGENGR